MTTRITPFLWFNGQAEEAMRFYTSIFAHSKIRSVMRYGEEGPGPKGTVMAVTFQLDGREFMALNGGPMYTLSPAISFFVKCDTQSEVDHFWEKLSEGGETAQGPVRVSWQVVPAVLGRMLGDWAGRVLRAMLQMKKLDVKALTDAYEQR
jgi:predicted 3-demethylubiquinone-9 3-methyltransferase (glyoxalase superfamily)